MFMEAPEKARSDPIENFDESPQNFGASHQRTKVRRHWRCRHRNPALVASKNRLGSDHTGGSCARRRPTGGNVFEVTGSASDDVIRGSDASVYFNPTGASATGFVVDFNKNFHYAHETTGPGRGVTCR
jgi:hypothetical protein